MKNLFLLTSLCLGGLLPMQQVHAQVPRVETRTPVLPVLIGEQEPNCVQQLLLIGKPGYRVKEVEISLEGSAHLGDISAISVHTGPAPSTMADPARTVTPASYTPLASIERPRKQKLRLKVDLPVTSDSCQLWVDLRLKASTDLSHRFRLRASAIKTTEGPVSLPAHTPSDWLRPGVAVRKQGQGEVHTSRIPGLTTTKQGTLLAIFDARYESSRDLQGHMDIGLHRSEDGGQSWQPMQVVLDRKTWGGLPERFNGVSDACALVDERTGDIYVAGLWMHGVLDVHSGQWTENLSDSSRNWVHQWQGRGSQPGLGERETSQFLITKSTDDGKTWSEPVNITAQTKQPGWWLYAPAPGHGITLKDGTLVFPTQGRDEKGETFSNITWSKDGGKTWQASKPAASNTTECMVAELEDGRLMLNMRDNRNHWEKGEKNGRNVAVTADLGETWTQHPSTHGALPEPTCMGSLHKHRYEQQGQKKQLLLFSNPHHKRQRTHMTLQTSADDGATWGRKLLLDEGLGFGYSCITSVNDGQIGILYEGSKAHMIFQKISLDEFTQMP